MKKMLNTRQIKAIENNLTYWNSKADALTIYPDKIEVEKRSNGDRIKAYVNLGQYEPGYSFRLHIGKSPAAQKYMSIIPGYDDFWDFVQNYCSSYTIIEICLWNVKTGQQLTWNMESCENQYPSENANYEDYQACFMFWPEDREAYGDRQIKIPYIKTYDEIRDFTDFTINSILYDPIHTAGAERVKGDLVDGTSWYMECPTNWYLYLSRGY